MINPNTIDVHELIKQETYNEFNVEDVTILIVESSTMINEIINHNYEWFKVFNYKGEKHFILFRDSIHSLKKELLYCKIDK